MTQFKPQDLHFECPPLGVGATREEEGCSQSVQTATAVAGGPACSDFQALPRMPPDLHGDLVAVLGILSPLPSPTSGDY